MKYILLVSHGILAKGMHSVLEMFAGSKKEVLSISLENGMSTDEFKDNLISLIKPIKLNDEVIVFADILGGSPFTMTIEILNEAGLLDNSQIFSGMNVPMCLSALLTKDTMTRSSLEQLVLEEGKMAIQSYQGEDNETDEEL